METTPDILLGLLAIQFNGGEDVPDSLPILKALKDPIKAAEKDGLIRLDSRREPHPTKRTKGGKPSTVTVKTYRLTPKGLDRLGSDPALQAAGRASSISAIRADLEVDRSSLRSAIEATYREALTKLDDALGALATRIEDRIAAMPARSEGPARIASSTKDEGQAVASWEVTRPIAERFASGGGLIRIPELSDAVTRAIPGLTPQSFRDSLHRWQEEDRLVLQICNDPRLEPRASEGIQSPRGLLFYVQLRKPPR